MTTSSEQTRAEDLKLLDRYWRAANYLSVAGRVVCFDAFIAAMLARAHTKDGDRLCTKRSDPSRGRVRNASAVFSIFVVHPKKNFATISANNRLQRKGVP
jgi:hypothetical protein